MDETINELSGRWNIRATNFPMWLSGKRKFPSIIYDVMCTKPLIVSDVVQYEDKNGHTKSIVGTDKEKNDGLEWRGVGIQKLLGSQWKIADLQDDMLVIQFEKTLLTPAGTDVLVRNGVDLDPKSQLQASLDEFGMDKKVFDSLTWLPQK